LPADIKDDRQFRLHRDDVREVLIRTHAEIHTARLCLVVSFETKLSERKYPPASENSLTRFQNASSLSCLGRSSVPANGPGVRVRGPRTAMSAVAAARMMRRRIVSMGSFWPESVRAGKYICRGRIGSPPDRAAHL
jgi:hypothetical protein